MNQLVNSRSNWNSSILVLSSSQAISWLIEFNCNLILKYAIKQSEFLKIYYAHFFSSGDTWKDFFIKENPYASSALKYGKAQLGGYSNIFINQSGKKLRVCDCPHTISNVLKNDRYPPTWIICI